MAYVSEQGWSYREVLYVENFGCQANQRRRFHALDDSNTHGTPLAGYQSVETSLQQPLYCRRWYRYVVCVLLHLRTCCSGDIGV